METFCAVAHSIVSHLGEL